MTAARAAELGLIDEVVANSALEAELIRRLRRFSGR
jgi:enoyl-CoA hydratase/carnithine racemase